MKKWVEEYSMLLQQVFELRPAWHSTAAPAKQRATASCSYPGAVPGCGQTWLPFAQHLSRKLSRAVAVCALSRPAANISALAELAHSASISQHPET